MISISGGALTALAPFTGGKLAELLTGGWEDGREDGGGIGAVVGLELTWGML